MPRHARIDQPGLLQHVMVRGIERRPIFLDDHDRVFFLDRLSRLLVETDTALLAWALMTNHFHLLIRLAEERMAKLMNRLLTIHAQRFNQRYDRVGHLFQNRYRSIVCQEQDYLLELVRYIHLNPLREGLATSLEALDRYPWSGHAVLLGNARMPSHRAQEVLGMFGAHPSAARKRYREFVAEGIPLGRRPELVGEVPRGGRPEEGFLPPRLKVLGNESFLKGLMEGTPKPDSLPRSVPLGVLHQRVAEGYSVDPTTILLRGRKNRVSEARAVFCYLAVKGLAYGAEETGRYLGIGGTGVSRAVRRGAGLAKKYPLNPTWIRP
jgi:putative transposase